jgi:hypothetical protein
METPFEPWLQRDPYMAARPTSGRGWPGGGGGAGGRAW